MDFRKIFKKRPIRVYLAAVRSMMIWPLQKMRWGGVGPFCRIVKPIRIINAKQIFFGRNIEVLHGARLEAIRIWNGRRYDPRLEIRDGVSIGQGVHITCADSVIIEERCAIMPYVLITDITHQYERIDQPVQSQALTVKPVLIETESFIGMGARIMPGVHIGRHSMIGANAVVTGDVPEYSVAVGIPARVIKQYNFATQEWEDSLAKITG